MWLRLGVLVLLFFSLGCERGAEGEARVEGSASRGESSVAEQGRDATDQRIVAEVVLLTQILQGRGTTAEIADAFEAHYAAHKERILAASQGVAEKEKGMSQGEREAYHDTLIGWEEVTAFLDALDAFQSQATPEETVRVESVLSEIYLFAD